MDLGSVGQAIQYLFMPIVVFAVVGALALVLRWSQTPQRRAQRASRRGLLVPIAHVHTQAAADHVADRLRSHGIRTTSATTSAGIDVLVWAEQYGEARLYVRDSGGTQPDG